MGGPALDIGNIKRVIMSQQGTFEYADIGVACGVSSASALKIIKDMVDDQQVVVDHKIGKRKIFAVSGQIIADGGVVAPSSATVKPDISQLPVVERFEYVGMLVDMVAKGISPSALITGLAGIGKTHIVKSRLAANDMKEDIDYKLVKGHAAPMDLYRLMHDNQDGILVFDDCDSVFKHDSSINLLKAALDSYDVRKVCWHSRSLPDDLEPEFIYNGQIIFVSNKLASQIDEAVKSRTFVVDLQMSRKEICTYLHSIVDSIEPDLNVDTKHMIIDELEPIAEGFDQFNIRTFIKACRMYRMALLEQKDWKDMMQVII